ncbi:MAG: HlyD family efflux transporter periplasmic adaptor subunit [Wenzhouxiangellaceae bacterium]
MNETSRKHKTPANMRFSFGYRYPRIHLNELSSLRRIRVPRMLRVLTWMIVLGLALTTAALVLIPWVQTTSGMGQVTTLNPRDRVQNISAMVSGRVAEWFVQEGDYVSAGDPIVRILDLDAELVTRLEAQLAAARRKFEAARGAVDTARLDYNRKKQLFEEGLASRLEYEQSRIKVQQLRVTEEEAAAALNEAEVNLSRQGSQLVAAPRDGTILQLTAGDVATIVSAGQTLASFMPANAERAVEIFIDGRDIGLVHPGRQVRLQFEGWPAFQFSGLPQYAIGTFAGEVAFVEPSARANGRFRVLIKEKILSSDCQRPERISRITAAGGCGWPEDSFVRLGANARGWILLDTVPLGFELWRLLNNFPPNNSALNTEPQ